jgi:hypothetical protein
MSERYVRSGGGLRDKTKPRCLANPGGDSRIPLFCPFEVFQILFKRRIVELVEELSGNRGIVPPNLIDQLTFVHVSYTFKIGRLKRAACLVLIQIGYSDVLT